MPNRRATWLTASVWKIALSAFFADLGYQAVLAGFPLFLVLDQRAPIWVYGMAMALSYGPGALIAWWGGRVGDRLGHKRIALAGNAMIPLLSLSGLTSLPIVSVGLLAAGWWARNFRSPSRRAMLREVVPEPDRGKVFGFLHSLDVAGGMLAGAYLLLLVTLRVPFHWIFLLTIIPLLASTLMLSRVNAGHSPRPRDPSVTKHESQTPASPLYRGVLLAASLYGFSSYSIGFPILTVAQGSHSTPLGLLAYVLLLGTSAVTGLLFGRKTRSSIPELAWLGYVAAAIGAGGVGAAYTFGWGDVGFVLPIMVLGFAMAVIETLEPTLVSRLVPSVSAGQGFAGLTGARSVGLFVANILMAGLYRFTPALAYGYAVVVAVVAASVLLITAKRSGAMSASVT